MALVQLPSSSSKTGGGTHIATVSSSTVKDSVQRTPRTAEFGTGTPSADVRWLADWIAGSRDNGGAAFIVVDKREAELHVFDADARWVASTAVLLGAALGDESIPGIGSRPLAYIEAGKRTTPAGRFVGERADSTPVQRLFGLQVAATPSSDDSLTLGAERTANIHPALQPVSR